MIGGEDARTVGEACIVAHSLIDAANEAERQGMPVIAARMRQAADIIEQLVSLLSRR